MGGLQTRLRDVRGKGDKGDTHMSIIDHHDSNTDGPALYIEDEDGDTLSVTRIAYPGPRAHQLMLEATDRSTQPVKTFLNLDYDAATALFQYLGEYLNGSATSDLPDATMDGYAWPAEAESILLEAQAAIYGDREDDYGTPRDNWTRTAILWTGLLQHKLADGEHITPEDGLRCMVAVKLARDVHTPKRDNRVDGAGYLALLDRLETGK